MRAVTPFRKLQYEKRGGVAGNSGFLQCSTLERRLVLLLEQTVCAPSIGPVDLHLFLLRLMFSYDSERQ